jgi:hypothetical protein
VLLDQGAQSSLSGVLAPQLLGFFVDLLAVVPHAQDFVLELFHSHFVLNLALLVLHRALLVVGIATPIERR